MRRFGIAAALCALALSVLGSEAALAQQRTVNGSPDALRPFEPPGARAVHATGRPYFIEFRSRSALSYGHSFVVFGRVGEKLTGKNVAGLHPRGDSSITYMLGHILLVPADTGVSDGDLDEQYLTARYRLMLSAAEYRTVVAHIREMQAKAPAWNAATYNCNAFVGTVAHFVGLTSPPTWLLPEDFINSMRQMNGDRRTAILPGANEAAEARAAMARYAPHRR